MNTVCEYSGIDGSPFCHHPLPCPAQLPPVPPLPPHLSHKQEFENQYKKFLLATVACYPADSLGTWLLFLRFLVPETAELGTLLMASPPFGSSHESLEPYSEPPGRRRCPEGWGGPAELRGINPSAASPQFRVLSGRRIRSGVGKGLWWLSLELGYSAWPPRPREKSRWGPLSRGSRAPACRGAERGAQRPRGLCPPRAPPLPSRLPSSPPLLAAAVVAMRCCETPVNKPYLEWSESPRAVCLVVRGSKVGIVPRLAITALPLPGPVSGLTPALVRPRRALPGEEGAQLLRTPGPARAASRPAVSRARKRHEMRGRAGRTGRPLRRQDSCSGASPEHGTWREWAEQLGEAWQGRCWDAWAYI